MSSLRDTQSIHDLTTALDNTSIADGSIGGGGDDVSTIGSASIGVPGGLASSIYSADDPLALLAPPNETPAERAQRLQAEADARRVSAEIDAQIKRERKEKKQAGKEVKLLLLGQAESGKSTLLKQWQLIHDPQGLQRSRASWKAVIYHNIAHVVRVVLNTLEVYDDDYDADREDREGAASSSQKAPTTPTTATASLPSATSTTSPGPPAPYGVTNAKPPTPTPRSPVQQSLAQLRLRLSPLVALEASLAHRLSGARPGDPAPTTLSATDVAHLPHPSRAPPRDTLVVRPGWQSRAGGQSEDAAQATLDAQDRRNDANVLVVDASTVLQGVASDVTTLWNHPQVLALRDRRRLRFDDWADYFLSSVSRVAASDYVPTIEDVLRARIQTIGVEEHVLRVPATLGRSGTTWRIHDVGGARGQRAAWVPFFEDSAAIIFLAPVSAFDQWLDEDPRTNRLDDSMKLFDMVCRSPILARSVLVLFLNKIDVLKRKLDAGTRVAKYITSYGDRPNDPQVVLEYFKGHFQNVFRRTQPESSTRLIYTHFTAVVDVEQTQQIIGDVQDSIFQSLLGQAAIM